MIERGASDISGRCNTINELKVRVHYPYGGGKAIYAIFGDKSCLLQKWRKHARRQSAAKCIVITKDFSAVRDLIAFQRIYLTFLSVQ